MPTAYFRKSHEIDRQVWYPALFSGWEDLKPARNPAGAEIGPPRIKWFFRVQGGGHHNKEVLCITENTFETGSRGQKILLALGVPLEEGDTEIAVDDHYARQHLFGRHVQIQARSKMGRDQMEHWLTAIAPMGANPESQSRGPAAPPQGEQPQPPPQGGQAPQNEQPQGSQPPQTPGGSARGSAGGPPPPARAASGPPHPSQRPSNPPPPREGAARDEFSGYRAPSTGAPPAQGTLNQEGSQAGGQPQGQGGGARNAGSPPKGW